MEQRRLLTVCAISLLGGVAAATLYWKADRAPRPEAPPPPVRASDASAAPEALASEAPAPGKVGFIDLESVFNECKQTKAYSLELEGMREATEKQIRPLLEEVKALKEKHDMMDPKSPERAALEAQIREKQKAGVAVEEPLERDLLKKNLQMKQKVYTLIRSMAQKVARARGVDLVLADVEEPHPDFNGSSAQDFDRALREYMVKMQRKAVLYSSKEVDLTSAVLEAVNAEP